MIYSIVIPVFRGSETITILFDLIRKSFEKLNFEYEVILVFDGGEPQSWNVIKSLVEKNPTLVKGIKLSRNFGQHNATICGFKYVKGDFIITIDEDIQHNPEDFKLLIEKQRENDYDLVYGNYLVRKHSFFRNITSHSLNLLLKVGIPDLHSDYSSFRLVKASIAKKTLEMNNSYTFVDGYFSWITDHVASVNVNHYPSEAYSSAYSSRKLISHSINIFITFSNFPIRLITWISVILTFFSLTYGSYILARKFLYNDLVSGFATFAVLGSFGLAILLFSLGVIGEYIFRISLKTTKRPNFNESKII